MTTPANQTTPAQTAEVQTKSEFEQLLAKDSKITAAYIPYGASQEIKLSIALIRRYIAPPYTSQGQDYQATDEECTRFLLLCRSRQLDPWTGDAYMVPFWDKRVGRPVWSLITLHAAFLKRAETHIDFDGMDSGIIVQVGDAIVERDGDFQHPGDKLLGGWATVYKKTKSHPKKIKVNLTTYKQPYGRWVNDDAGMICKVAEAQAIRDSFPSQTGDLYLREENKELGEYAAQQPAPEVKRPELIQEPASKPRRRPTMVEEPLDKPAETTPAAPEPEKAPPGPAEPADSKQPPPATDPPTNIVNNPESELLALAKAANITEAQLTAYLKAGKYITAPKTKIQELSTERIDAIVSYWKKDPEKFVKRIMEKQG